MCRIHCSCKTIRKESGREERKGEERREERERQVMVAGRKEK
jgi:hypothetical protein